MSKAPSEATQLANARRDFRALGRENDKISAENRLLTKQRDMLTKELAEWKTRFDLLLAKPGAVAQRPLSMIELKKLLSRYADSISKAGSSDESLTYTYRFAGVVNLLNAHEDILKGKVVL